MNIEALVEFTLASDGAGVNGGLNLKITPLVCYNVRIFICF